MVRTWPWKSDLLDLKLAFTLLNYIILGKSLNFLEPQFSYYKVVGVCVIIIGLF